MKRGDDRPRESSKRKKRTGPVCVVCGYQWEKKAEEGEVATYRIVRKPKGDDSPEEFVHVSAEACRAHKLCVDLGVELGASTPEDWLFVRYPRARLLVECDVRPGDWKATGWMPRSPLDRRLLALILYSSWCYPICMAYAVQTGGTCPRVGRVDADPDNILVDGRTGLMYPFRQKEAQLFLNESQPAVSRAVRRLIATKDIRVDEDNVIWPAAKLLEMTIGERMELYAQQLRTVDEGLRGVPKELRPMLLEIEAEAPSDIRSVIFESVKADTEWWRTYLQHGRSELIGRIVKSCGPAAYLLPDLFSKLRSSSSPSSVRTTGSPVPQGPGGEMDDDEGTPNELYVPGSAVEGDRELLDAAYAAGLGKGALNKLPPRDQLPALLIHARMQHWLGSHPIDMVIPNAIWAKARKEGWTAIEVCWAIEEKGPLAGRKKNPAAFLRTCVENLLIPSNRDLIRRQVAENAARAAADAERDRVRIAEQSVADAAEAAFEARISGMPADEWEQRVARSMKRLAAEAKASKREKLLTPEQKHARAETAARRELREEMDSEASAGGQA